MIKFILLVAFFLLFLCFSSFSLGELICKKFKYVFNKYLTTVIGYASIIAFFQLCYYPAQWFQLSSLYLFIFGIIIFIILIFIDIKNIKQIFKFFFDYKLILIILVSILFFWGYIKTAPEKYYDMDDSFYMPLMYHNANTNNILTIEPRSGLQISKLNNLYAYQGYYLMGSFFIKTFQMIIPKINYTTIILYIMSSFSFFMLSMSAVGISFSLSNDKVKRIFFLLLYTVYTIFLPLSFNLLNTIFSAGYDGFWVVSSIFLPITLYLVFEYLNGKNTSAIISIFFITQLSCLSSSLFLNIIILYGMLAITYYNNKKTNWNHYLMLLLPILIYVVSFLFGTNQLLLCIILFTILFIYFMLFIYFKNIKEFIFNFFNKILGYILILIPLLCILLTFYKQYSGLLSISFITYFNGITNALFPLFNENVIIQNAMIIPTFVNLLFLIMIIKNIVSNNKSIVTQWIVILFFVFCSPFTISIVHDYLSSGVYIRILLIVINPITYYYLFDLNINNKYLKTTFCIFFVIFSLICFREEYNYFHDINVRNYSSSLKHRVTTESLDIYYSIDKAMKKNNIKHATLATDTFAEPRIINPNISLKYTRLTKFAPDDDSTIDFYYDFLLYNFMKGKIDINIYNELNINISDIFNKLDVNFIIINKNYLPFKSELLQIQKNEQYRFFLANNKKFGKYTDNDIKKDFYKNSKIIYSNNNYDVYYITKGEQK